MESEEPGAEDAVQDAFCGLYRHWDRLTDQDRAQAYVRTAVLNACRSALRRRASGRRLTGSSGLSWTADGRSSASGW